ncbi:MAG TPA: S1/P1 Nuclease, partial [Cytophagales bacterium]|nr:S1/P1 Nuclease [Cytophagales bacterium]
TGHRVVGHLAEQYLTKKASRNLASIMGGESLARASTWMDEMKSDSDYRYMNPWHYVNLPADADYTTIEKPENGEVVGKINQFIAELKAGGLSKEEQIFRIRCLVHLVGDLHQPFHTGRYEDLGGNRIKIKWFGEDTNLHRLWDSDLIDFQQLSYTELAEFINHPTEAQVAQWQSTSPEVWVMESHELANQLYESVEEGEDYSYRYNFDYYHIAERRMLMAGIRLAAIFNDIYG